MQQTTNDHMAELIPAEARARAHKACAQNLQIFREVADANKCSPELAAMALLITFINGHSMLLARIENSLDAMCGAAAMEVLGVVVKEGPQQ